MNNKILYAIIAFVLLGGAGIVILNSNSEGTSDQRFQQESGLNSPQASDNGNGVTESDSMQGEISDAAPGDNLSEDGRYVLYSDEAFEEAQGRRVMFFYANWCPTCIPADKEFKSESERIPEDVTLLRINYNDDETEPYERDLAEEYGVTYQHTFVQVDENGEEVAKWNGGATDELLQNLK